jgi:hypothetical protein
VSLPVVLAVAPPTPRTLPPLRRPDRVRAHQRDWHDLVIQRQPAVVGYFDKVPYAVALVDIDEQPGLRLPGRVLDIDPDAVAIGMSVSARLDPLPGGDFVVPVWVPNRQ